MFGETQQWFATAPQGEAVPPRSSPVLLSRDFRSHLQAPSHGLEMSELDDGGISRSGGYLRETVASEGQEPQTEDVAENLCHASKGGNIEGGRAGWEPTMGPPLCKRREFRRRSGLLLKDQETGGRVPLSGRDDQVPGGTAGRLRGPSPLCPWGTP